MLKVLATTENAKIKKSEEPIHNRGNWSKKQREVAVRNFQTYSQSRAVFFETEGRVITNNKEAK